MSKIRVRFAPSPTGFLHIGGLRTALYNYLFVKKNGGDFILRIEDTDQTRSVEGGVENIIKTLQWCGLKCDEGPKLSKSPLTQPSPQRGEGKGEGANGKWQIIDKGPGAPYIQSQRLEIYQKRAEELVKKGKAYYCFCSPERLEKLRQEQMARHEPTRYDKHCKLQIANCKLKELLKERVPYVIRLKVPEEGRTKFTDIVRGEVIFENKLIDDQVLLKSDGYPTYHLANVVDDHLMKISHVIRGEEWLPSTPKHILLYEAFGWQLPQFAHLPLLLNADRSKLSKRQGDVAVEDYIKKGYLCEALLNFIALLGWNPKSDKELYSLPELIQDFKLEDINKSGAVVNFEKLDWMNGHYIRQEPTERLTRLCIPYLIESNLISINSKFQILNPKQILNTKFQITKTGEEVGFKWLTRVIALEQERLKKLSEIVYATEFFFVDLPRYKPAILVWKKTSSIDILRHLDLLVNFLETVEEKEWQAKALEEKIKNLIEKEKLGTGETLWPFRVALSGRTASPPPFAIAALLGKEKTLKRLKYALELAPAAKI